MAELGITVPVPPNPAASRIDVLRNLWLGAGLIEIETPEITVQRTFTDFENYWTIIFGGPNVGPKLKAMTAEQLDLLKERMRTRLSADSLGRISYSARANAIKGRVSN